MAGLFQVLYGEGGGKFKPAEVLKGTDGQPLIIPEKDKDKVVEKICTRPFAIDWDGDGDLDLVVGTFAGSFYLFKGEGKGKFQPKPELIKAGDQPLKIKGYHSDPFVIDWDGDGDLDLLSGSTEGGAQWAENLGGKGKPPRFSGFEPLIKPAKGVEYGQLLKDEELTGPTSSTRLWVEDVNGDGKLDVFIGDSVTLVSPAKGLSVDEFKKKREAWEKEMQEISKEMNATNSDQEKRNKVQERFQKHYEAQTKFMIEKRTGFVWLYLQK